MDLLETSVWLGLFYMAYKVMTHAPKPDIHEKILETVFERNKEELEMLEQIAYLAEGMFDCEVNNNLGDAEVWKHKLKAATDEYYNHLLTKH